MGGDMSNHHFESDGGECTHCGRTWIEIQEDFEKEKRVEMKKFTDEELEQELARRKEEKEKAERPKPTTMDSIDGASIVRACEEYMDNVAEGRPEPDEHYIVEVTLKAVYGKNVYDWINKQYE